MKLAQKLKRSTWTTPVLSGALVAGIGLSMIIVKGFSDPPKPSSKNIDRFWKSIENEAKNYFGINEEHNVDGDALLSFVPSRINNYLLSEHIGNYSVVLESGTDSKVSNVIPREELAQLSQIKLTKGSTLSFRFSLDDSAYPEISSDYDRKNYSDSIGFRQPSIFPVEGIVESDVIYSSLSYPEELKDLLDDDSISDDVKNKTISSILFNTNKEYYYGDPSSNNFELNSNLEWTDGLLHNTNIHFFETETSNPKMYSFPDDISQIKEDIKYHISIKTENTNSEVDENGNEKKVIFSDVDLTGENASKYLDFEFKLPRGLFKYYYNYNDTLKFLEDLINSDDEGHYISGTYQAQKLDMDNIKTALAEYLLNTQYIEEDFDITYLSSNVTNGEIKNKDLITLEFNDKNSIFGTSMKSNLLPIAISSIGADIELVDFDALKIISELLLEINSAIASDKINSINTISGYYDLKIDQQILDVFKLRLEKYEISNLANGVKNDLVISINEGYTLPHDFGHGNDNININEQGQIIFTFSTNDLEPENTLDEIIPPTLYKNFTTEMDQPKNYDGHSVNDFSFIQDVLDPFNIKYGPWLKVSDNNNNAKLDINKPVSFSFDALDGYVFDEFGTTSFDVSYEISNFDPEFNKIDIVLDTDELKNEIIKMMNDASNFEGEFDGAMKFTIDQPIDIPGKDYNYTFQMRLHNTINDYSLEIDNLFSYNSLDFIAIPKDGFKFNPSATITVENFKISDYQTFLEKIDVPNLFGAIEISEYLSGGPEEYTDLTLDLDGIEQLFFQNNLSIEISSAHTNGDLSSTDVIELKFTAEDGYYIDPSERIISGISLSKYVPVDKEIIDTSQIDWNSIFAEYMDKKYVYETEAIDLTFEIPEALKDAGAKEISISLLNANGESTSEIHNNQILRFTIIPQDTHKFSDINESIGDYTVAGLINVVELSSDLFSTIETKLNELILLHANNDPLHRKNGAYKAELSAILPISLGEQYIDTIVTQNTNSIDWDAISSGELNFTITFGSNFLNDYAFKIDGNFHNKINDIISVDELPIKQEWINQIDFDSTFYTDIIGLVQTHITGVDNQGEFNYNNFVNEINTSLENKIITLPNSPAFEAGFPEIEIWYDGKEITSDITSIMNGKELLINIKVDEWFAFNVDPSITGNVTNEDNNTSVSISHVIGHLNETVYFDADLTIQDLKNLIMSLDAYNSNFITSGSPFGKDIQINESAFENYLGNTYYYNGKLQFKLTGITSANGDPVVNGNIQNSSKLTFNVTPITGSGFVMVDENGTPLSNQGQDFTVDFTNLTKTFITDAMDFDDIFSNIVPVRVIKNGVLDIGIEYKGTPISLGSTFNITQPNGLVYSFKITSTTGSSLINNDYTFLVEFIGIENNDTDLVGISSAVVKSEKRSLLDVFNATIWDNIIVVNNLSIQFLQENQIIVNHGSAISGYGMIDVDVINKLIQNNSIDLNKFDIVYKRKENGANIWSTIDISTFSEWSNGDSFSISIESKDENDYWLLKSSGDNYITFDGTGDEIILELTFDDFTLEHDSPVATPEINKFPEIIGFDLNTTYTQEGWLLSVIPQDDEIAQTYEVEISEPEAEGGFVPGDQYTISIYVKTFNSLQKVLLSETIHTFPTDPASVTSPTEVSTIFKRMVDHNNQNTFGKVLEQTSTNLGVKYDHMLNYVFQKDTLKNYLLTQEEIAQNAYSKTFTGQQKGLLAQINMGLLIQRMFKSTPMSYDKLLTYIGSNINLYWENADTSSSFDTSAMLVDIFEKMNGAFPTTNFESVGNSVSQSHLNNLFDDVTETLFNNLSSKIITYDTLPDVPVESSANYVDWLFKEVDDTAGDFDSAWALYENSMISDLGFANSGISNVTDWNGLIQYLTFFNRENALMNESEFASGIEEVYKAVAESNSELNFHIDNAFDSYVDNDKTSNYGMYLNNIVEHRYKNIDNLGQNNQTQLSNIVDFSTGFHSKWEYFLDTLRININFSPNFGEQLSTMEQVFEYYDLKNSINYEYRKSIGDNSANIFDDVKFTSADLTPVSATEFAFSSSSQHKVGQIKLATKILFNGIYNIAKKTMYKDVGAYIVSDYTTNDYWNGVNVFDGMFGYNNTIDSTPTSTSLYTINGNSVSYVIGKGGLSLQNPAFGILNASSIKNFSNNTIKQAVSEYEYREIKTIDPFENNGFESFMDDLFIGNFDEDGNDIGGVSTITNTDFFTGIPLGQFFYNFIVQRKTWEDSIFFEYPDKVGGLFGKPIAIRSDASGYVTDSYFSNPFMQPANVSSYLENGSYHWTRELELLLSLLYSQYIIKDIRIPLGQEDSNGLTLSDTREDDFHFDAVSKIQSWLPNGSSPGVQSINPLSLFPNDLFDTGADNTGLYGKGLFEILQEKATENNFDLDNVGSKTFSNSVAYFVSSIYNYKIGNLGTIPRSSVYQNEDVYIIRNELYPNLPGQLSGQLSLIALAHPYDGTSSQGKFDITKTNNVEDIIEWFDSFIDLNKDHLEKYQAKEILKAEEFFSSFLSGTPNSTSLISTRSGSTNQNVNSANLSISNIY